MDWQEATDKYNQETEKLRLSPKNRKIDEQKKCHKPANKER